MLPFREVWLSDFEFQADAGEQQIPVCATFREYLTGRELRLWQDELAGLAVAPIPTGRDVLFVAYFASAELGCFLALGWPLPEAVLDLYVEHRAEANGLPNGLGNGLLGALAWHGLDSMSGDEKDTMRKLVLRGGPWTASERAAILDYCAADVHALARLLPRMLPGIVARGDTPRQGLGQALFRGRYMAAVARMEHQGVPLDRELLSKLTASWAQLVGAVIETIADDFPVFDGASFRAELFGAYLAKHSIAWPRLDSGRLDLSDDTFREMARAYPKLIGPIREVRVTLADLRLHEIAVGQDARNRVLLSPFSARSGRNAPSNSKFVYGPATWIRSLITAPPGRALAYIDFSAQEIAIAAALSGDDGLWGDYLADPYLGFGKRAKLIPATATKHTHREDRDRFKAVVLGVNYGMTEHGLALRLAIPLEEARQLLRAHRRAYPTFWAWSDAFVDRAQLTGRARSVLGWPLHVRAGDNPRSLRNFPMQAGGADMLRLACVFTTEAGIAVCAPVHDALLIEAAEDEIDHAVAATQEHMRRASELVLGNGRCCHSDAIVIRPGERFRDERGVVMFERMCRLLTQRGPAVGTAQPDVALSPTRRRTAHSPYMYLLS